MKVKNVDGYLKKDGWVGNILTSPYQLYKFMIIENKAAKTLDFGNPQNLHPSKIYMHTGIYHMLQMIHRIMIILWELV